MLSVGDGIALGCAILGAIAALWMMLSRPRNLSRGNNPESNSPNKFVLQRAFDTYTQATNRQLDALSELMTKGFDDLRKSIRDIHGRIDDFYGSKTK